MSWRNIRTGYINSFVFTGAEPFWNPCIFAVSFTWYTLSQQIVRPRGYPHSLGSIFERCHEMPYWVIQVEACNKFVLIWGNCIHWLRCMDMTNWCNNCCPGIHMLDLGRVINRKRATLLTRHMTILCGWLTNEKWINHTHKLAYYLAGRDPSVVWYM